jgi:threonine/homoserine/homoserine lactone efflux protein
LVDQILLVSGLTLLILISPGPDMALVLRNTFIGERIAGAQTAMGILTGNLLHISYCVAGVGLLVSRSIVGFSLLKYAGAAYLLYLGVSSLLESNDAEQSDIRENAHRGKTFYLQGLLNNILNPKGTLF